MRTNILSDIDEPTDNELTALMVAVSVEAKRKFSITKIQLNDKINAEIVLAQARHKIKQK